MRPPKSTRTEFLELLFPFQGKGEGFTTRSGEAQMPVLRRKPAACEPNTPDHFTFSSRQQLCVIVEADPPGLRGLSLPARHTPGCLFRKLSHLVREKLVGTEPEHACSETFPHFWPSWLCKENQDLDVSQGPEML